MIDWDIMGLKFESKPLVFDMVASQWKTLAHEGRDS